LDFNSGAELYVEDTAIRNFSTFAGVGIRAFSPNSKLVVENTVVTASEFTGVELEPSAGTLLATIDHSRFEDGAGNGVEAFANATAVIRDSVASGNASVGFFSTAATSHVDVENSLTTHNGTGLGAGGIPGTMRVSET